MRLGDDVNVVFLLFLKRMSIKRQKEHFLDVDQDNNCMMG